MRNLTILLLLLLLPLASSYADYSSPSSGFSVPSSLLFTSGESYHPLSISVADDAIYRQGWYSLDGKAWIAFNFSQAATGGWITSGQASTTLMVPQGASTDNYVIIYSCSNGGSTWDCHGGKWQIIQFNTSIQNQEELAIAINAGGEAYTASDGTNYIADAYYTEQYGNDATTAAIAGTTDDTIYQTDRVGRPTLRYRIPLPVGTYSVTLQFAEIWFGTSRTTSTVTRTFDVALEGQQAINDLNILSTAGPNTAYDVTRTVTVTDGYLDLVATTVASDPKISGIVIRQTGAATPTCTDGMQNQGETGIDCGGPCTACVVPTDGIFVSPMGSDSNTGAISSPFKTLEKARDYLRSSGQDTVWLRGGTYERSSTLVLDSRDDGTSWRAYPGEDVTIIGGKQLAPDDFSIVTSSSTPNVWNRLHANGRGHVMQIHLSDYTTDYGTIPTDGFDGPQIGPLMLTYNHEQMRLGRYPNYKDRYVKGQPTDMVTISGADCDSEQEYQAGNCNEYADWIQYGDGNIDRWTTAEEPWLWGRFMYQWAEQNIKVRSVDAGSNILFLSGSGRNELGEWGIRRGAPFFGYNLLEEIDEPGEFYLNRDSGILYLYPPDGDMAAALITASIMEEPIIHLDDADHVTFDGINIEAGRDYLVEITDGTDNVFRNCRLVNSGLAAAYVTGQRNGFDHCEIAYHKKCIVFDPIDENANDFRNVQTPQENFLTNTLLHHITSTLCVDNDFHTVGNHIAHNEFHTMDGQAINFMGTDHLIEYNDISNILLHISDAGVMYAGRDWTTRGTIIQYNYIHDIHSMFDGIPGYDDWIHGIYLDDAQPGMTVRYNIFSDFDANCIYHRGGRDNKFFNNIFYDCGRSAYGTDHVIGGIANPDHGLWYNTMWRLYYIPYQNAVWSAKYPELAAVPKPPCPVYQEDQEPCKTNFQNYRWTFQAGGFDEPNNCEFKHNLGWQNGQFMIDETWSPGTLAMVDKEDNLEASSNPFSDMSRFQVRSDVAASIGFEQIPFDEIGIQN